ncbi:MAG: hypothetical protein KGI79_02130 [Patescibacteria group bacterium]|nr:hypothetical protein [Patescibacteria group bacterium]MDE2116649.1 hypothetical protein [Patescibacteria group bacterium]
MDTMAINLKKPLIYVTRDIERALGMKPGIHGAAGYFIISNDTAYGREARDRYGDFVRLIASGDAPHKGDLDTYDLLCLPDAQKIIDDIGGDIIVFQNTLRIERLAAEKGWRLLNPSALLAKTVEEKISQIGWLGDDARLLPPFCLATVSEIEYAGKRFVLQFNHAHTGQGTHVIDSAEALAPLRTKFPHRECRITDFIDGPVFTVNAVIGSGRHAASVVIGEPSYQITGLAPFTDMPFATIGNDWALAAASRYEGVRVEMTSIAQAVGARLKKSGWKGLFGIDVVYDPAVKKTYLLEINARQPASAVFESQAATNADSSSPTIFEDHVMALLGEPLRISPDSGRRPLAAAQIVKRATDRPHSVDVARLRARGLIVLKYENTAHNKELFRIQAAEGIMKDHNELDVLGKFISSCIR